MKATIAINSHTYTVDFSKPIDISITLSATANNPLAWYLNPPKIKPVQLDDWVGSVAEGASVNFNTIEFNPHAHGTHTECVGHITKEFYSIHHTLKTFFFTTEVISITPKKTGEDFIITKAQVEKAIGSKTPQAVVIRTLPNDPEKKHKNHSHTNWPYVAEDAAAYLNDIGVLHLLIDLPSVDKEKDDGKLAAHKAFWGVPHAVRLNATITEFIFLTSEVIDGSYILNLQVANFNNDAAPSRPVLYKIL